MAWGGGSEAAARRAGRYGLDFVAFRSSKKLRIAFEEESRSHGQEPGTCGFPSSDRPGTAFVAEDLDRAWEEIGPYLLYDVRSNAEWNQGHAARAVFPSHRPLTSCEKRAERTGS